ncbi:MAG: reverse transcriptase [Paludibacteraceae bacterium]|nr:reverse transcriptase [Paludibacteraceae bacterium]MBO6102671.1 hypothetical protein [Opitutales bacterium]MBO7144264.1 reverse transcriptase [Salinivirgaceae bacterium]
MKRYGNLYDKAIDLDNLRLADSKARKGKARQRGVKIFDRDREGNLQRLHEILKAEKFETSQYTVFTIYEPKERQIYRLPYYPDRIVHHAIMNVLEPIWTRIFTYNTYSCIKGRGIAACAAQVERIIKEFEGRKLYCLKIDLKKYYPSIDNEILKQIVRRKIKDGRLLKLIDNIIDSERGLPIGNYLSQYLSNLYLAYFMHYCNETLKIKCVEYADDIVFFSDDKNELHRVFDTINAYLGNGLHLTIKSNYQIFPIAENRQDRHGRALDYVGFKFYRKQKLIRKSIKQNFCRAVAKLTKRNVTPEAIRRKTASWYGWATHSNSRHLLKKLYGNETEDILQ